MELARTIDDFTPALLSDALGTTVTAVEVTPIAVGEGFMGRLARLVPTYAEEGAGPASLVAKVPTDEPGSLALGQMLGVWEREASFYRRIAPQVPTRVAACHYAEGDEAGMWSLLLEDLAHATVGDQVAGAAPGQAEAAVDWLAGFHAAFWGRGEQAFPWLPKVRDDPIYQGLQPMLEAVFPKFVADLGADLPDAAIEAVGATIGRLTDDLSVELTANAVIHADFRLDNLFFGVDGEVIPVDWQSVVVGQPLYDLTYFFGTCLPVEVRRATERDLLARWREQVARSGAEPPAGDDLFDAYRQMMLTTMRIGALLFGQIDFSVNERAGELARCSAARLFTAGADLGVAELA